MSYRCIRVKRAECLLLEKNNLHIKIDENREVSIPVSDISIILIEDNKTTITGKLLTFLSQNYVSIIICDNKFMPATIVLPLFMHYKQLKVFQLQMKVKKPIISQLWFKIIEAKIRNQKNVLELTTNDEFYYRKITDELKNIKSNDKTNREAVVAKYYFSGVFGPMFTRRQASPDEINSALNYGYTILMSMMTRVLAMYGFNTIFGIHHKSYVNNFNLACDLMEPFRPLVDLEVYKLKDELVYPLPTDVRERLVSILFNPIKINGKTYKVQYAMEEMVKSYIHVLEKEDSNLLLLPLISLNESVKDIDESDI